MINKENPLKINPNFFSFLNASISVFWAKYTTVEELFEQLKEKKNDYVVLKLNVGQIREMIELEVTHSPTSETRSHTLISIKSHEPKSTQDRVKNYLAEIAEWVIEPVIKKPIHIRVACVGFDDKQLLKMVVTIINSVQKSFEYSILSSENSEHYQNKKNYFTTEEIYELLKEIRKSLPENDTNIFGICKPRLDGKKYSNLFSSLDDVNGNYSGLGIITLYQLADLLGDIPVEVYLLYRLIDYGFRLIIGRSMLHDEPERRFCFYDRKVHKTDITIVLKKGILCEKCTGKLKTKFRPDQLAEFYNLLQKIVAIANSPNPKKIFMDLYKDCI